MKEDEEIQRDALPSSWLLLLGVALFFFVVMFEGLLVAFCYVYFNNSKPIFEVVIGLIVASAIACVLGLIGILAYKDSRRRIMIYLIGAVVLFDIVAYPIARWMPNLHHYIFGQ